MLHKDLSPPALLSFSPIVPNGLAFDAQALNKVLYAFEPQHFQGKVLFYRPKQRGFRSNIS